MSSCDNGHILITFDNHFCPMCDLQIELAKARRDADRKKNENHQEYNFELAKLKKFKNRVEKHLKDIELDLNTIKFDMSRLDEMKFKKPKKETKLPGQVLK